MRKLLVVDMLAAKKPIGVDLHRTRGSWPQILRDSRSRRASLTIGTDEGTAAALEKIGVRHLDCPVEETRVDAENRVVSTPAYMLAGSIKEAAEGIEKLVAEVLELARG